MYAKWTSKETQSLNLIIGSQQHNDLSLSQQQKVYSELFFWWYIMEHHAEIFFQITQYKKVSKNLDFLTFEIQHCTF